MVESTNLFSTVVVTDDGKYVSVPNGPIWAKSIKNRSRIRPMRVILDITVNREAFYAGFNAAIDKAFKTDHTRHKEFTQRIKIVDLTADAMVFAGLGLVSDRCVLGRTRCIAKCVDGPIDRVKEQGCHR